MGNYSNNTIQIETLLSVSPTKLTDPAGLVRRVLRGDSGALGGCLNVLLYYTTAGQGDSGWLHAGWIKESLGRALSDLPALSGRVRRSDDGAGAGPGLEVVSNDSGVRLVEARMAGVTLSEFLGSGGRREAESELVFWKDIDGEDLKFSPLFYVQVTNFECGGYSFGISCSLLLADLLFKENFLKKWAKIHNTIMLSSSTKEASESPIFYLPKFKRNGRSTATIFSPSPSPKIGQTMIFDVNLENKLAINSLALLCVEEAERKILGDDHKMASKSFSLFVSEPGIVKVEKCPKQGINVINPKSSLESVGVITSSSTNWDILGAQEVEFCKGNRPVHNSIWINGSSSDKIVVAIPSEHGAKIIVTVPNEI